jgi:hypothetical protein
MPKKKDRDIENGYSTKQMVAKLRRLSDCLENRKQFKIQIAGERIQIPAKAKALFKKNISRHQALSPHHNASTKQSLVLT